MPPSTWKIAREKPPILLSPLLTQVKDIFNCSNNKTELGKYLANYHQTRSKICTFTMIGERNSRTLWISILVVSPTLDCNSEASLRTCSQKVTSFASARPSSVCSALSSPSLLVFIPEVAFCNISRYMHVPANSWRRRFRGGLSKDEMVTRKGYLLHFIQKILRQKGSEKQMELFKLMAYLSSGIWCMRVRRLTYEL